MKKIFYLLVALLISQNVLAQSKNWTGATSNDWNTASNWSPSGVPTSSNYVTIASGTPNPVLSTTATVISVQMNNNKQLTVSSTGRLNLIGDGGNVPGLSFYETSSVQNDGSIYIEATNGSTLTFTDIFWGGTSNGSSLINNGLIRINSNNSVVSLRLGNTITNNTCGKIIALGGGNFSISGGVTNSGLIETSSSISLSGAFTNSGILKYNSLSGGTITNSNNASIIVNNSTPIFTYGGTYNGTGASIVNGIFTNTGATTSAGTFTAPNTFVPSGSLPTGSQTLYAKITPSVGACNYVVPFTYNNVALPIIELVDASNNPITNGGAAGTANNTDFGTICLTGGTVNKTYTIKNTGNSNLTLSGSPLAVLGGADASQFSITTQPTSPISATGSVTFTVQFDPSSVGLKNATVTLTSNDPSGSPYVINIKGTGGENPDATISTTENSANIANDGTICLGTPVAMSVPAGASSYLWSVGATSNTLTPTPGATATYSITVTNNGCAVTSQVVITVLPRAQITLGAVSPICAGDNSFLLPYTVGSEIPTTYSIPGSVTETTLPASPITVNLNSPASISLDRSFYAKTADGCRIAGNPGFINFSVTVNPINTVSRTSAVGTTTQSVCINTPISNITYATTRATGAIFDGLPAGITGSWADDAIIISGTPSESGIFNYVVTLTGGCGTVTATGTLTVTAIPTLTAGTAVNSTTCTGNGSIPFTSTNLPDGTYSLSFTATGTGATSSPKNITVVGNAFTLSGLKSGTYSNFSVINNGCTGSTTTSRTITEPTARPAVEPILEPNPTSCGGSDGRIVFSVTNTADGTHTFNYKKGTTAQTASVSVVGGQFTISDLTQGTYSDYFFINSVTGCSGGVVSGAATSINLTDPTFTITPGTVTNPTTCGGVGSIPFTITSNNQSDGTFSLSFTATGVGATSSPQNVNASAATGTFTLSGLKAGTYSNFSMTRFGCTASISTSRTITNPASPVAPIVGTITQPTCTTATGSVVLSGLPSGNWTINPGNITGSTVSTTVMNLAEGTYNFTVTNDALCVSGASVNVDINPQPVTPTASISYEGTPFCKTLTTGVVTRTGTTGGTFSSTVGLSINTTTGEISPSVSTPGVYVVVYTIAASSGCPEVTATTNVTITSNPTATITYIGTPFCKSLTSGSITIIGSTDGTFSSTAGLTINAATGEINPSNSIAGVYTVTYTIAASGGCSSATATTSVTISNNPSATISYAGSPYCSSASPASVNLIGTTGGGFTSAPAGLTINATTGQITPSSSTAGV